MELVCAMCKEVVEGEEGQTEPEGWRVINLGEGDITLCNECVEDLKWLIKEGL